MRALLFAAPLALALPLATFGGCSSPQNGFSSGSSGSSGNLQFGDSGTAADTGNVITEACAKGKTGTRKLPGYIQLVLDGSGSMDGEKWTALQAAVRNVSAKWATQNDPSFGVGVSIFSDSKDPTDGSGPYPTSADVKLKQMGTAQKNAINTRVSGAADGLTPSNKALTGNYTYLKNFDPATAGLPTGGKKILVFMSDGAPTDDSSPASGTCKSCALAKTNFQAGITTFSILFADEYTDPDLRQFMGTIAKNGGGLADPGCSPTATSPSKYCHFEIDTTNSNSAAIAQKFQDAIEAARGSLDACTLAIEKQDGVAFDPNLVNVTIKGSDGSTTNVYRDPADGWSFDDDANPNNVVLHGSSCDSVKADADATVDLVLGCPSITR